MRRVLIFRCRRCGALVRDSDGPVENWRDQLSATLRMHWVEDHGCAPGQVGFADLIGMDDVQETPE